MPTQAAAVAARNLEDVMFKSGSLGLSAIAVMLAAPALAQEQRDLGEIAKSLTGQITNIGTLIGVTGMGIGLAMLVMSALKLRALSNNDHQATLGGVIGLLVAGIALVALPEFMGVGVTSLFGAGTEAGGFSNPLSTLGSN